MVGLHHYGADGSPPRPDIICWGVAFLRSCTTPSSAKKTKKVTKMGQKVTKMSYKVTKMGQKVTKMSYKVTKMEQKVTKMEQKVTKMGTKMKERKSVKRNLLQQCKKIFRVSAVCPP